jgi:hypothetical protein
VDVEMYKIQEMTFGHQEIISELNLVKYMNAGALDKSLKVQALGFK